MNLINIDGRHILEAHNQQKFDARMRTAFFAVVIVVIGFCAKAYDDHLRLPEKAVCANTVHSQDQGSKFSPYYVECSR